MQSNQPGPAATEKSIVARAGQPATILGRTSLQLRMRLINAIFLIGIVSFIVITHQALQLQLAATDELIRLSEAEQYAQDADRLHDSLRGDLYAALLTPTMNESDAQAFLQDWQAEVRRFHDDLQQQSKLRLPTDVEQNVDLTRERAEEFLVRTQDLMDLASRERESLLAQLPEFEARFSELGATFASLNTLLSEELAVAKRQAASARDRADQWILLSAAIITGCATLLAWTVAYSIRRSIRNVAEVAHALAEGQLDVRYTQMASHEVGAIGASLNRMADSLERTLSQMRADSDRDRFNKQLAEAFEIADSESEIAEVSSRAMQTISQSHPTELLLADPRQGAMTRAAEHPLRGAPGCTVERAADCVAVRRGSTVVFADSEQLNACPYLRDRPSGASSAVCVPLGFMGRSLGVLHATSTVDAPIDDRTAVDLETLALQAGTRTGTVRAFRRTQLEALTDGMTGLLNRRALEAEIRELAKLAQPFALVLADLDHFKKLNDTYGHRVGDRALRTFADAIRAELRNGDRAARWGGEEFLALLVGAMSAQAYEWTQRVRVRVAQRCEADDVPKFTSSFGIADSSMWSELTGLFQIADAALYISKNEGRDRATIGTPDTAIGTDEPEDTSSSTVARVLNI